MEHKNITKENLTDKAFSRLMLTSILSILVCLVCLCSTTWAWFSATIPSESNLLSTAADCQLLVSVTPTGSDTTTDIVFGESKTFTKGEYDVLMTLPAGSASGYLVIYDNHDNRYYSPYILQFTDSDVKSVSFKLVVEDGYTAKLTSKWGICAEDPSVTDGGVLNISDGEEQTEPIIENTNQETEETFSSETEEAVS